MSGCDDSRQRCRRRRQRLTGSTEAQSGVVGTLLAISIFGIIISLVVSDYIPRWQEDKEAEHAHTIQNQIATFKGNVDRQILDARLQGNKSLTMYNAFTMGVKGVAVFSTDARGDIQVNEYQNQFILRNGTSKISSATGTVAFNIDHQYYIDQQFVYENGGVIVEQDDGQYVEMSPQFSVYKDGGVLYCSFTMVSITSAPQIQTSSEKLGIKTQVVTYQQKSYSWSSPETLTLTATSQFPQAWAQYYNHTLPTMGLEGADYSVAADTTSVTVQLNLVRALDLGFAGVSTTIERGWS